ncbi:hypothetical protein SADUNF_Sadunf08G0168400 [Salix dunnii]|uniref:Uncharacterized protein n=1 Tax=Salix dunnii TaxID=1413687 RepID=A0A835MUK4_9ROSI|nr:hypothetical protein SADUNF_Sadunf08G0168400 [Salix dunnii]
MYYSEFVVCYDIRTKFLEVIRIWQTQGNNYAMAYKPSFVSLKDVMKITLINDILEILPHTGSKMVEKMTSPFLKEHVIAPVLINFLRAFLQIIEAMMLL